MKLELMQNEDKLLEEMHKLETEKQVKITQITHLKLWEIAHVFIL